MPRQMHLKFRPPVKARTRGLPVTMQLARTWVSERVLCGGWSDRRRDALLPVIQSMQYDDALLCDRWRLEFLWLNEGYSHYRLYWYGDRRHVFGVADVRSDSAGSDLSRARQLPFVQQYLASYLVAFGWQAERVDLRRAAALTPLDAETARQYRLFTINLDREAAFAKARAAREERDLQARLRSYLSSSPAVAIA